MHARRARRSSCAARERDARERRARAAVVSAPRLARAMATDGGFDRSRGATTTERESVNPLDRPIARAMSSVPSTSTRSASTMPDESGSREDVQRELRLQRESRAKSQPRGRITAEDVARGVLETRASVFHADGENVSKARGTWRRAATSARSAKFAATSADVSNVDWTDVDALFSYYDAVHFEGKLGACVSLSWHVSPAEKNEAEDAHDDKAKFENLFKYCLCSDIPKWWHGANPRQLCVGVCCIVEKRAAQYTRVAHLRMPDVLRRFKMTQMTKEALLHAMTHAFLFVTGHTKQNEAFNAHDDEFKRIVYKLNHDLLTMDAYRPPDKGYQIRWFDRSTADSDATRSSDRSGARAVGQSDSISQSTKSKLLKSSIVDTLTPEHYKLLYFISKHSRMAEKVTDKELWVRYIHVMVLVYEAIVAGVFDYDYAPYGEMVGSKRMLLNVSQEARDNLDDLVEAGMLRSLRMSTALGASSMAYQLSTKGFQHMNGGGLSRENKELCDSFLYDPSGSLMNVMFVDESETFKLASVEGYNLDSTVTESEDVSYVCSPYICRQFMRNAQAPLTSYAYRASESVRGLSTVADALDATLSMSRVIVMIADWIPTSCTQITELSRCLGVKDRNKGGYHSSEIDCASTDTCLEIPAGVTRIKICNANAAQYCNMEAEVEYPEASGVTQVEAFGLRCVREGDMICGLKVESVMTKILNDIPLDWITRVVVDIQIDSTKLTTSIMSPYQQHLLETVYDGDVPNRQKFSLYLAETITPKMRAHHYLDGDSVEAEVRQLIGDTKFALDVTESDIMIIGDGGIIFAGPECTRHEALLLAYCMLRARENFCTVLYRKLSAMKEALRNLQSLLEHVYDEPNTLKNAHLSLAEANTSLYRLGEATRHMTSAMETPIIQFGATAEPEKLIKGTTMYYALNTKSAKRLSHALALDVLESTTSKRIRGCYKHYKANEELLHVLQKQAKEVMRERRLKTIVKTKVTLEETRELMEHIGGDTGNVHTILSWLYLGLFAFRLIDRFIGSWTVSESVALITKNIRYPLMWDTVAPWLLISLSVWAIFIALCALLMRLFADRQDGFIDWTTSMQRKVCVNTLLRYLKLKSDVGYQQIVASDANRTQVTRITYREVPKGIFDVHGAKVTLTVDTRRGYLLKSRIRIAKSASIPGKLFPSELQEILLCDLELNGVLLDGAVAEKLRAAHKKSKPLTLFVRAAGEPGTREIMITEGKLNHLREKIASKFCHRVKNLVRMSLVVQVDEKTIDEEVIETDSQVALLQDFSRINVVFFGRPKPNMAKYIRQVEDRQSKQNTLKERRALLKKSKKVATVHELYPEPDDENDVGF